MGKVRILSAEEIAELGTTPFWSKCQACGHCWVAAYMPMEVEKCAKLMKRAACPKCATDKPVIANQSNGTLLEDGHG